MKPPPFRYEAARDLDHALAVLAEEGDEAKVLAGGQSLIPLLNMRLAAPSVLVDITRVAELSTIEVDAQQVRVGAAVRHAVLERHEEARRHDPLLAQALLHVAHPVIRNRGTTVGSIAHADPAGEMPAVLAVLGGTAQIASVRGQRTVAAADLFVGPMEAALAPDEVLTGVSFPHPGEAAGTAFHELARRHGDYAMAGVAAVVTLDDERRVTSARVGFLGVAGVPVVADCSAGLVGQPSHDLDVDDAVAEAVARTDPHDDIHASAAYRRHLAGVLTARALRDAAAAAADRLGVPA